MTLLRALFVCLFLGFGSAQAIYEMFNQNPTTIDISKIKTDTIVVLNTLEKTTKVIVSTIASDTNTIKETFFIINSQEKLTCTISQEDKTSGYKFIYSVKAKDGMLLLKENDNAHQVSICQPRDVLSARNVPVDDLDFEQDFSNNLAGLKFKKIMSDTRAFAKYVLYPHTPRQLFKVFLDLYKKNAPSRLVPDVQPRIPKILHHIWLGGPFPEKYKVWRKTWLDKHPTWTHLFWTDNPVNYSQGALVGSLEELRSLLTSGQSAGRSLVLDVKSITMVNRILFDQAKNYGEKSDILRYEALYQLGGAYLDTDLECLEPLDVFHHTYDFFTVLTPINLRRFQVANGFLASIPGHPILKVCLDTVRSRDEFLYLEKIPSLYTGISIIAATGPVLFTKAIATAADKNGNRDVVLPTGYCYARRPEMLKCSQDKSVTFPPRLFIDLPQQFSLPLQAFAVHYWETSWKPEA